MDIKRQKSDKKMRNKKCLVGIVASLAALAPRPALLLCHASAFAEHKKEGALKHFVQPAKF